MHRRIALSHRPKIIFCLVRRCRSLDIFFKQVMHFMLAVLPTTKWMGRVSVKTIEFLHDQGKRSYLEPYVSKSDLVCGDYDIKSIVRHRLNQISLTFLWKSSIFCWRKAKIARRVWFSFMFTGSMVAWTESSSWGSDSDSLTKQHFWQLWTQWLMAATYRIPNPTT